MKNRLEKLLSKDRSVIRPRWRALKGYLTGFASEMRNLKLPLAFLIAGEAADRVTTWLGFQHGAMEANPLALQQMAMWGQIPEFIISTAVSIPVTYCLGRAADYMLFKLNNGTGPRRWFTKNLFYGVGLSELNIAASNYSLITSSPFLSYVLNSNKPFNFGYDFGMSHGMSPTTTGFMFASLVASALYFMPMAFSYLLNKDRYSP